jgi:hypothetical protein
MFKLLVSAVEAKEAVVVADFFEQIHFSVGFSVKLRRKCS